MNVWVVLDSNRLIVAIYDNEAGAKACVDRVNKTQRRNTGNQWRVMSMTIRSEVE